LVASEIVTRFYLTIGFLALISLSVLAATSTDGMIRRLGGRRWRRVHQSVYVITGLALVHYFIQSKLNVAEPTVVAGVFFWLMANRAIVWIWGGDCRPSFWSLIKLSIVAALLAAIGEATYNRLANGFDPWRVLAANVSWHFDRRPGWIVLAICLALTMASLCRAGRGTRLSQSQTTPNTSTPEPA
jgi:sulfoxide reductase heme-binding subunit YedZ